MPSRFSSTPARVLPNAEPGAKRPVQTELRSSLATPGANRDDLADHARGQFEHRLMPSQHRQYERAVWEENEDIFSTLTSLDDRLIAVLEAGLIRFIRSAWLVAQPVGFRLPRRQELEELEKLEATSQDNTPFLSAKEAVRLVRRGDRSAGALSHGWLCPSECDPHGARVAVVQRALQEAPRIKGLFWDQASLPQAPRSADEAELYQTAIGVMCDLYASAIGTTVLQLSEIPPRPTEYDGSVCLFLLRNALGVVQDVDERTIRSNLSPYGLILHCDLRGPLRDSHGVVLVRYSTHSAAIDARDAGPIGGVCSFVTTLYNERSYDGGKWYDDDSGRGW